MTPSLQSQHDALLAEIAHLRELQAGAAKLMSQIDEFIAKMHAVHEIEKNLLAD